MKIFNIDFNKSGSTSLTKAMDILGFRSIHWKYNDKRILDRLNENKKNKKKLLSGIENFDFYSDFRGSSFYKKLDKQYPNSKFIITIRNLDNWLISREKHVKRNQKNPDYKYDFLKIEKKKWVRERKRILNGVKSYFKKRPKDLLIINSCDGEGWEKLCPFLSKKIPKKKFPFLNKTKD